MIEHTTHRLPFTAIPQLSQLDTDYATHPEKFADFVGHDPTFQGIANSLKAREVYPTDRAAILQVLREQYARIGLELPDANVPARENSYCVITAHQPSLLTGPLYFIYKICSAINLARKLQEKHPDHTIYPLFILGGEDHDFEEINHVHFFGRTFTWASDQKGSVGRMITDDLLPLLDEIREVLGSSNFSDELRALLDSSFIPGRTYGESMHHFVASLFEGRGLYVIQLDHPLLKRQFSQVLMDELFHQTSSDLIPRSQSGLERLGYKPQAYVREINLFYLKDDLRNRIEFDGDRFQVVDTSVSFTAAEMESEVVNHPERFSPNVNLRPLYQETVLPNLAYIGGGGELAYWLERKIQFEHYKVPFPVLIRRNSVLYINKGLHNQRARLDIPLTELFSDPEKEISKWVREHAEHDVEIDAELATISEALDSIVRKAEDINPSFARSVEAFKVKALKDVDHMGKRLVREEKSRNETNVKQIRKLFEKLFPDGNLQERHDNFIPFYLVHGSAFIDTLIQEADPLLTGFMIIEET